MRKASGQSPPHHPLPQKGTNMSDKISVNEALGFDPDDNPEAFEEVIMDSVVPACCSSGCQVEPDGHCEHGHPSVLLELGII